MKYHSNHMASEKTSRLTTVFGTSLTDLMAESYI